VTFWQATLHTPGFATTAILAFMLPASAVVPVAAAQAHSLAQASSRETVLYAFTGGEDGAGPVAGLVEDATGAFYGTTTLGGGGPCYSGAGCGTVFKLTPSAHGYVESVLYRFNGTEDGAYPWGGLALDASGALYGTTVQGGNCSESEGCGTVFKLTPRGMGYKETILHSFEKHNRHDGAFPDGSLIIDGSGTLYGTTGSGGESGYGSVFKLAKSGDDYVEKILHSFHSGNDGEQPLAGLIADPSGALYGTTNLGGSGGDGTVFKLTPQGSGYAESVIYAFQSGGNPYGSVIGDASGALYGTTTLGPGQTNGTVFELTPAGGGYAERDLYTFPNNGLQGGFPYAGLVTGRRGALYGTTIEGGAYGLGTAYSLTPKGVHGAYTTTVVHSFGGGNDGNSPADQLIADKNGALYGTTKSGGTAGCSNYGCGTVFRLNP